MSQASDTPGAHDHAHPSYVKIWAILLGLLVVSVVGPMAGIKALTLITAFGIAVVKAYLVARYFMHIDVEPRYIAYLLGTCLTFMLLLFAGVAPDVMRHEGQNWTNDAAAAEVRRASGAAAGAAATAPLTPEAAFRGTCTPCHGAEGRGDGPASRALDPKPANFTDPAFWASRDRDHVARVIRGGGAAVGRSPTMPPFGAQFDEARATALADYIVTTFRPAEAALPSDGATDGGVALPTVDGGGVATPTPSAP